MENLELEQKYRQLNAELMNIINDIDNLKEELRNIKNVLNETLKIDNDIVEEDNINLIINNLKKAKFFIKNQMKSK